MSSSRLRTRGRPLAVLAVAGALVLGAIPAGAAPPSGSASGGRVLAGASQSAPAKAQAGKVSRTYAPGKYIVMLKKAPIASYTGGTASIPATRPLAGRKVQVASVAAQQYRAVLRKDQSEVAAKAGVRSKQNYTVALNGFTATLTAKQAAALAADPKVLAVSKDAVRHPTDNRIDYDFWHLAGLNGVWSKVGGISNAGKGVVVGDLDTGIWPESKSFAGAKLGSAPDPANPVKAYRQGSDIVMHKADGQTFTGTCQAGPSFPASTCNTKIISARYYGDNFLASLAKPSDISPFEYLSPRDGDGHGSHTASTAAGNNRVHAVVEGNDFGFISGVAPAASIAVYKVCWQAADTTQSGCFNSDMIQAIDQAVADGVDVINFSIGGSTESGATDPVEIAFLSAASAGIFVSASAGNSGPGASTLDHPSPWLTTVAASTMQPREGSVILGNGRKFVGNSTTVHTPIGPKPFVAGVISGLAAAPSADAARCFTGTLDPAKVTGKIVECDRGGNTRVEKSAEVKRAGGVGMVMVNLTDNSVNGDLHSVPTVHINVPGGLVVKAYAQTAGATVTLVPGNITGVTTPFPQVAGFSSRGPSQSSNGNLLKPDIAAPGVDILAAVAPPSNSGRKFDFISGTSMAAPHIAGLAALYKAVRPGWSPMAIKSAIMTTARSLVNADGSTSTDLFAQGAGNAEPGRMFSPGLIYPAGDRDWLGYLEGLGIDTGTGVPAIDASNYNQASFADSAVVGKTTLTRRVMSVSAGLYVASASVPGYRVTVSPSILFFDRAGLTKQFRVTFTRTTAPLGDYAMGFLTWKGAHVSVRSPVVLQALAVKNTLPVVTITGASGSRTWPVVAGVTGPFPIKKFGLAAPAQTAGSIAADGSDQYTVVVKPGTKLARFATFVANDNNGADIDLSVSFGTGAGAVVVGTSGSASARETVDLKDPPPGTYVATVNGFSNAPGSTATAYLFRSYQVGVGGVGNFTVTPANSTVVAGQTVNVTASASGLDPNINYLGWIEFIDGSGSTFVANPGK